MSGLHEISIGIILEEKHFVSRHQITKQEQERNCMFFVCLNEANESVLSKQIIDAGYAVIVD